MDYDKNIVEKVSDTLVRAGSVFLPDKKEAYKRAIESEVNQQARWTLEMILKNAITAEKNCSPLCDDTGIPHLVLEVGPDTVVTGKIMQSIREGIRQGLRKLPGRPMAIKGNDFQRIDQSLGMDEDPGALEPAPVLIRNIEENVLRLHVLMFGGGPAIRGKTYRIFHKHNVENVLNEIISWATDATAMLGCTPCTLAIGVGRSHYEAASMMLQALVDDCNGLFKEEFRGVEANICVSMERTDAPEQLVPEEIQDNVLDAVMACHDGVLRNIPSMPGIVETSSNLAIVNVTPEKAEVLILARSSDEGMMDYETTMLECCFNMAGMKVEYSGRYGAWQPNFDSPIVARMVGVYKQLFGEEALVQVVHAGLECSLIGQVYPKMDMVSFGPTLRSPHTPDERCHIPSVAKFWTFMKELLRQIPEKD